MKILIKVCFPFVGIFFTLYQKEGGDFDQTSLSLNVIFGKFKISLQCPRPNNG